MLVQDNEKGPQVLEHQTDHEEITIAPSIPQNRTLLEMLCDADKATTSGVFGVGRHYVRICNLVNIGGYLDLRRNDQCRQYACAVVRSHSTGVRAPGDARSVGQDGHVITQGFGRATFVKRFSRLRTNGLEREEHEGAQINPWVADDFSAGLTKSSHGRRP